MPTLAEQLAAVYRRHPHRTLPPGECLTSKQQRCALCHASTAEYPTELQGKSDAIRTFWKGLDSGIECEPLVTSPQGRNYRTVSKRKAFLNGRRFFLGLIGVDDESSKSYPMDIGRCAIEPASHAHIYAVIQEYLQRKEQSQLVTEFNYVIVKGDDREAIVILNMNHFSSANRREVNALSKSLTFKAKNVTGLWVFTDEERSRYYLPGAPRKGDRPNPKPLTKVYGADTLLHTVHGMKFLHSPLSFTQTNHSIVEAFVQRAGDLLQLKPEDTLFDLYCGYGLFSLSLASKVRSVTALELSRSSISDAIGNAKRNKVGNVRFHAADISIDTLPKFMHHLPGERSVKVLLDPPRNGTSEEVIEFIAEQRPERVLHIFCNADVIGSELKRWKKAGYRAETAVPFDMFPGTTEIEMMVALVPA